MEHKVTKHGSSNNEEDQSREIIEEFRRRFSSTKQKDIEKFVDFFYKECQKDSFLFCSNNDIQLNKLNLSHAMKIQEQVEALKSMNQLDIKEATSYLYFLDRFCKFLTQKEVAKIYYILPIKQKNSKKNKNPTLPLITDFEVFLNLKRYSHTTIRCSLVNIKSFLKFFNYTPEIRPTNEYWSTSFKRFEEHLIRKSLLENIQLSSAYEYLKAVRLFSRFLYENKEINFIYNIPTKMIQNAKRCNEYTNESDILLVIKCIFEYSKNVLRDISIFLIILETGCRPIEIVNLKIDDVYLHEKLIVLKSKKSHQRTLLISGTTCSLIKDYLKIRKNYLINQTDSLFINKFGNQITSSNISNLFRKYNKPFQEKNFTPKTLRHTFITNALNNGNSMEQVREIVGHKHLISTHYYFYRNIEKLKKLFLDKKLF
ncbi:site-specific integrase [Psychrobacillus sp. FSL K6-4615]|uniref:tyrosine-type recombinase/integrase n=1 Tax=Psychrobacillus sp. FSL K6-4615 TaxID=2921551 RepID=UPI0030FB7470